MKHAFILAAMIAGLSSTAVLAHPHGEETAEPAKKTWPYFGDKNKKQSEEKHSEETKHSADKKVSEDLDKTLKVETTKTKTVETIKKSKPAETPKALVRIEKFFKKHADNMEHDIERAERKNKLPEFDGDSLLDNPDDLRAAAKALENMLAESDFLENMADMVIGLAENIEVDSDDDGLTLRFDGETLGSLNLERSGEMNDVFSLEGLGQNLEVERDVIIKNGKKRTRIVIEMDTDEDVEIDVKPKR